MTSSTAVSFHHVGFSYGRAAIVEGVDFAIAHGEFIAMIGPNGGGKTTIARLLLGLLKPVTGEIELFGADPEALRHRVGYVPQTRLFDPQFPISAFEVALMGRLDRRLRPHSPADRWAATEALQMVGLEAETDRQFADLSGGQRQRALVARALVSHPDMLLLDEPTANIDLAGEDRLAQLLQRLKGTITIILITHDLSVISDMAERVLCVNRTVSLHPTQSLTDRSLSDLYGRSVRLVRHDLYHA